MEPINLAMVKFAGNKQTKLLISRVDLLKFDFWPTIDADDRFSRFWVLIVFCQN